MIHLHNHSHYSVLDGLGRVPGIVKKAKEIGAPAVAITDHASISAMPELFKEAKANDIKPIIGCEFYVVDNAEPDKDEKRHHLTVLAKSWAGVESLMAQLSLANQQFYRRPRLTFEQALDFKQCVIMSACSAGFLSHDDWECLHRYFAASYGVDFYLEIMPHNVDYGDGIDGMRVVNERAMKLCEEVGAPLVATNDAHYINKDDSYTHEILLAIQSGKQWDDPKRWKWDTDTLYMRSAKEMMLAFATEAPYVPMELVKKSILTTIDIMRKCNVEMPKFEVHMPSIYEDDEVAFEKKILAGSNKLRKVDGLRDYANRLKYEVGVVRNLGFIRYFLMVEDIINWARERDIMVGPARGSAAGSLVCYLMGITQVDPLKHGLYFERFLNPERIDLPDIDVDFQDNRREEVFKYINEKYGAEYTANINTFGKLTMNTAFRDVARTFGIHPLQINLLSKQIEDEDSFESVPELVKFAKKKEHKAIIVQAKKLKGVIRQQGVHACGYIVSSKPLNNVSVIEKRKGVEVVNWDMRECEKFGLLKVDVLGLSTLTVLNHARKLIKERYGTDIDYTEIPLDDEATLAAFSRGEGSGVFQFENSGMSQLLRDLKANTFEMITDATALYRPGSLESGETKRYVQVSKGYAYEEYIDEALRPILSPTKGVMVYQEQIMQIFNQLAGFSWAEADRMRKIIGKKLGKDEFNKHRKHFVEGCDKNGTTEGVANEIFDKMVEFAAYSFNKSHAVAYTLISYWCMYLKVHYTLEVLTAILSHYKESSAPLYVKECERLKINVLKPDINLSEDVYTLTSDNEILAPLGVIKGVGAKAVETILGARAERAFISLEDMVDRIDRRKCNSRIQGIMVRAGAFESLGLREPSKSKREKAYAELLPIFNKLPSLDKEDGEKVDKELIEYLYEEIGACSASLSESKRVMAAKSGAKPAIMVINAPVKGEREHLTNKGTKHFLNTLRPLGFTPKDFYYTSPVKCFHKLAKDVTNECHGKCRDFLWKEIEIVNPKLIICFTTNVLDMFVSEKKPSMGKLHGQVVYNKEFDAYVLFSYSPQYAFYSEDVAGDKFLKAMATLGEIFY